MPRGRRDLLDQARKAKKDEFYTQLSDIEAEMYHHRKSFVGKRIYLNCDDPKVSNFYKFFSQKFLSLGLEALTATSYQSATLPHNQDPATVLHCERQGGQMREEVSTLSGDGDFRSRESIDLLQESDVVITNPPFSLFREYIGQLFAYKKDFLILGNMNAVTYKEVFPRIQAGELWYGASIRSGDREFAVPDDYPVTATGFRIDSDGTKYIRVKGVRWFTNLDYEGRHTPLDLSESYSPEAYPKYANFDAIEVGKTSLIPFDYEGPMGVPISFLDKYSPEQFEILGSSRTLGVPMSKIAEKGTYPPGGPRFYLARQDGSYRRMYDRIVVRNLNPGQPERES